MRTSLPENRQIVPSADPKRRNSRRERRLPHEKAVKLPSLRSRSR
jgi:hypothetical protein